MRVEGRASGRGGRTATRRWALFPASTVALATHARDIPPRSMRSRSNPFPVVPPFVKLPSSDELVVLGTPEQEMRKCEFPPLIHHEKGGSRLESSPNRGPRAPR